MYGEYVKLQGYAYTYLESVEEIGLQRVIWELDYMGKSQNYGPILLPLDIRCRNITYNQKPILLRTAHIG